MQDRFKLASLLSMAYALLIYPLSRLDELLPGHLGLGPKVVSSLLNIVGFLIFIYIFSTLKWVLQDKLNFNKANKALTLLTIIYAMHGAVNVCLVFTGDAPGFWQYTAVALTVGVGVSLIVSGYQLKQEPRNIYGLGQWLSYLFMAMGAFTVTVIWARYGVLVGVVAYLLLSIIFSRAEHDCETTSRQNNADI